MTLGKHQIMIVHVVVALVLVLSSARLFADAAFLISVKSTMGSQAIIQRHGGGLLHAHHTDNDHTTTTENEMDRRDAMMRFVCAGASVVPAIISSFGGLLLLSRPQAASARLEAVNRPDLLPKESRDLYVIQTEKMLTSGQAKRMDQLLHALERDTGFRVRLLCQNYPNTPGLAIRDYWDLGKDGQKDDKYVVLVVDTFGERSNALNFNVGDGVKFALPNGTSTIVLSSFIL
jgi:TPM domain